jgi:glycosyltransferase involved in cell wall biosynthesis
MNDLHTDLRQLAAQAADRIPNLPRISIITPCLNGERYIVESIESVMRQGYPNCEHMVVDGASTDATLRLLQRFSHLRIISEPDRGSHEAMNKGVGRASGDVIAFLNVDDSYPDNTLLKVGAAFAANPGVEILVGDTIVYEDDAPDHRVVRFIFNHPYGNWLTECMFGNPGINGCFFRRSVFEKVGLFNNDFHICADRDFVTRASLAELPSISLNMPTLFYRSHSGSQTINRTRSNILRITNELFRMASLFLESGGRTPGYVHLARAWHAFEGARLALVQIRSGQLSNAAKLVVGCSLRNPLWLLYLIRAMYLRHIVRRHYRGGWNADVPILAEVADGLRRC